MDFSGIKNIVFDLGGVIINLDFNRTYAAFAKLTGKTETDIKELFDKENVFRRYETGALSEDAFFRFLNGNICRQASIFELKDAWNALLLDIPGNRIELLKQLKTKYKLYLLSNTNDTHIQKVNEVLTEVSGVEDLKHLFHKTYYSFEINLAKPSKKIYDFVTSDEKLDPKETVFLDDTYLNLTGASDAGWKVLHVRHPETILELLENA